MLRRDFLKSVPPVVLMPQQRSAPRLKITDIRVVNLKSVRETGKMEAAWNPGTVTTHRIGGGSVIEIHTDQGLSGIGPAIDNGALESGKLARRRPRAWGGSILYKRCPFGCAANVLTQTPKACCKQRLTFDALRCALTTVFRTPACQF
jgi:hypothetical protein